MRRSPGTRRWDPEGKPACSGEIRDLRETRKFLTSFVLSMLFTVRRIPSPDHALSVHLPREYSSLQAAVIDFSMRHQEGEKITAAPWFRSTITTTKRMAT